jgi:hypothetical protein
MLPTKFWFIWQNGFRGEEFKKSANQKQELPVAAMVVNGSEGNGLADFFNSSPLKPLCQMNRNLVGRIYGRFSIKFAHFLPIH